MLNLTENSEGSVMLKSNKTKKTQKKTKGRPMYETEADLENEADIAEKISHTFKVALDKMPISYGLDFFVTKADKAMGVMEVKKRNIKHDAYPTYMISLLKWNKGLQFHHFNHLRFSIAIMFTDGLYRYVFREEDLEHIYYEFGGRTKTTRDSADLEPVVRIPMSLWQKVPIK